MAGASNPRTARAVIDQAISENKAGERLLYAIAVSFVTFGLVVMVWAMYRRELAFAAVGTLAASLFWPAINSARRTRKESIAIRLLEAPLSRADTAKEAAEMLHQLFREIYRANEQETVERGRGPQAVR